MDWVQTFLSSNRFEDVDEPLFTALNILDLSWITEGEGAVEFVKSTMHRAHRCGRLYVKRFAWLTLMLVVPAMQDHVVRQCARGEHYARWWIRYVRETLRAFLSGEHASMQDMVSNVADMYVSGAFLPKETLIQ